MSMNASSPELASRLMKTTARYSLVHAQLIDVYKVLAGIDFRHASLHCTCAICQDIRKGLPNLIAMTGAILEKIKESEASDGQG